MKQAAPNADDVELEVRGRAPPTCSELRRDQRQRQADELAALTEQVNHLRTELEDAQGKRADGEELEDCLVLLDELGGKRKADKARLRELGETVSEDEDEGEDDEA